MEAKRNLARMACWLCLLVPFGALAQTSSIGLYADVNATRCAAVFNVGVTTTIYIIATRGADIPQGITCAEFRVVGLPEGWFVTCTPNPAANVQLGDPFHPTGDAWFVAMAFPECQPGTDGRILLYTVDIFPTTQVDNQTMRVEAAAPPSNPHINTPAVCLCDDPIFTMRSVLGGSFGINQGPDYQLTSCDVGVSDTTPIPGQTIQFEAMIRNRGATGGASPVPVRFLLDGAPFGADVLAGPLASGDSLLVSAPVTWTTEFAPHALEVVVDPDSLLVEYSETNNRGMCRLPYELHPVALAACPPASGSMFSVCNPCLGDTVTMRALVTNTGAFAVDSVQVEFRDRFGNGAVLGAVVVRNLRQRGECAPPDAASTLIRQPLLRLGNHPIEIVVDPQNVWPEYDESNNRYEQTLSTACYPASWFDYRVTSCDLGVSNPQPVPGEPVHFQARLHNIGTRGPYEPVRVRFLLDGVALGADIPAGPLAAGDSVLVASAVAWNADFSPHELRVIVDPDGQQDELAENNNQATCPLPYELHPVALAACPPVLGSMFSSCTPALGDTVTVRALVTNSGLFAADSVQVEFHDRFGSGSVLGTVTVHDLRPHGACAPSGAVETLMGAVFLRLGDHPIEVVVDPQNAWPEYDETNNRYQRTLPVRRFPASWFDYRVTSCDLGVSDSRPGLGQPIYFQTLLHNAGTRAAYEPVRVRFLLDGVAVGADVPVGPLGPGATVLVAAANPWNTDFAPHTFTIVADPEASQDELSETNNQGSCQLPYELHPLAIPTCPPEPGSMFSLCNPCLGDTVTIRARVINSGVFAVDSVQVEFVDRLGGDTSLGTAEVDNLRDRGQCAPEHTGSAEIRHVFLATGAHPIQVVVDPHDAWPEFNENDNTYQQALQVASAPAPDVVLQELWVLPSREHFDVGDEIDSVLVRVQNVGRTAAHGVWVEVRMDGVPLCDAILVGDLPAGAQQTVAFDTQWVFPSTPGGDYELQACADPVFAIDEMDESNNCSTLQISRAPWVAVTLTDVTSRSTANGLLLAWKAQPDCGGFAVERRMVEGGPWERLGTVPVPPQAPAGYADYSYLDTAAEPETTYEYRILGLGGAGEPPMLAALTVRFSPPLPARLALLQNFPNPFNPSTRMQLTVPQREEVTVRIYDAAGRWIADVWRGALGPGTSTVSWDGRDCAGRAVPSGTYYCAASAGNETQTKKLVLLR